MGAIAYAAWMQWLHNYYGTERPKFTNTTTENGPEDIAAVASYAFVSLVHALSHIGQPVTCFAGFPMVNSSCYNLPRYILLHFCGKFSSP
jgi:hypothetical protein